VETADAAVETADAAVETAEAAKTSVALETGEVAAKMDLEARCAPLAIERSLFLLL